MTVTGGMLIIGALDVFLGYVFWPHRPGDDGPREEIRYDVPQVTGKWATLADAGVPDAPAAAPRPVPPPPPPPASDPGAPPNPSPSGR